MSCNSPSPSEQRIPQGDSTVNNGSSEVLPKFDPSRYLFSRVGAPDESPFCMVSQMVGVDLITIKYRSTPARTEKVFGDQIPFGEVWMTGDYIPTTITSTGEFFISEQLIPAGEYAIWTVPGEKEWTIIFNSDLDFATSGLKYNQAKDIARIRAVPTLVESRSHPNLIILFSNTTYNSTSIDIRMRELKVSFFPTFKNDDKILKSIEDRLTKIDSLTWDIYKEAADFCDLSNTNNEKGLEWINKSIALEPRYAAFLTKSNLQAKSGDFAGAAESMKKAIEEMDRLGDIPDLDQFKENLQELQANIK